MIQDEFRTPKTALTVTMEHGLYKQLFLAAKIDGTSMNKLAITAIRGFLAEREERREKINKTIQDIIQELFEQDPTGSTKLWYDERLDEAATKELEDMCRAERTRRFAEESLSVEDDDQDY